MSIRVTVLGGSGVATPELVEALRQIPNRTQEIELVLVGRSASKLEAVAAVCKKMAKDDPTLTITSTTDLEAGLAGADFILNQIRVGGLEGRVFDESFPIEYGIPGEETVGPGGFSNAYRTIPAVLEYMKQVEKICPQAQVLTFVNPSSMVQYAISRYTGQSVIGLCDAPVSLSQKIAKALGLPEQEIMIDYTGMHHFGFVHGIWHQGKDYLPEAIAKAALICPEIDPKLVEALGLIPGHYLNYIFHPDRMLAKKVGKRTRAEELLQLQEEILQEYGSGISEGEKPKALERRGANWYKAVIAPVLSALIETRWGGDKGKYRFILNLKNNGVVPWLPVDAIVETPALIQQGKVVPLSGHTLPADAQQWLRLNCEYEMLAVESIVENDAKKAVRALLLNKMVPTYDQAQAIVDRIWKERTRQ